MLGLKVLVNTQTPPLIFHTAFAGAERAGSVSRPVELNPRAEERDFHLSPGGVTRMVLPLLRGMMSNGTIEQAHWVSLNPNSPPHAILEGIHLHHISMPEEKLKGYGKTKEAFWSILHGESYRTGAGQVLWQDEFSDYTFYNRITAEQIRELDKIVNFDLFYIHDFQQLAVGNMLHTLKPKLFRWHIPFEEATIPRGWRKFLSAYLNSYDSVIVSSKRYLKTLKRLNFTGKARYVYPYIDPAPYKRPTRRVIKEFCRKYDIQDNDQIILVVARMDPMKGQDKAVISLSKITEELPHAKLLLVGNGSFSGSGQGLNLSKAVKWVGKLERLAKRLDLEKKVIFAGHVTQQELNAAYERCSLTLLPSIREGFGLVVIESWLFLRPTIVTSKAGIAELIEDRENGFLVNPTDSDLMAERMSALLKSPSRARAIAARGYVASEKCLIGAGVAAESKLIEEMV